MTVIVRFYQPCAEGYPNGWQIPVPSSAIYLTVTVDGQSYPDIAWAPIFSYAATSPAVPYINGQYNGGFDQHAQYFWPSNLPQIVPGKTIVGIQGYYQLAGYFTVVFYFYDEAGKAVGQREILDKEMKTAPAGSNPYQKGNPSIFAYNPPSSIEVKGDELKGQDAPKPDLSALPPILAGAWSLGEHKMPPQTEAINNQVYLYRPNKESSTSRMLDGIKPDGCSADYLITDEAAPPKYEVMILRLKMPSTFIYNNTPPTTFGDYQCRYLSVNSNINGPNNPYHRPSDTPVFSFWTVDNYMLTKHADPNTGHAYIFFATDAYVQKQMLIQNMDPKSTIPPVITWGYYRGYLLGPPKSAIILRYRDPSDTWAGSPAKAVCAPDIRAQRPIQPGELGDYTPEIYGDSMSNFQAGNIGPVNSKGTWPKS